MSFTDARRQRPPRPFTSPTLPEHTDTLTARRKQRRGVTLDSLKVVACICVCVCDLHFVCPSLLPLVANHTAADCHSFSLSMSEAIAPPHGE